MSEGSENEKVSAKSNGGGQVSAYRTKGQTKLILLTVYGLNVRFGIL